MASLRNLLGLGERQLVPAAIGGICCNISPENNYHNMVSVRYAGLRRKEINISPEMFRAIELEAIRRSGYSPEVEA